MPIGSSSCWQRGPYCSRCEADVRSMCSERLLPALRAHDISRRVSPFLSAQTEEIGQLQKGILISALRFNKFIFHSCNFCGSSSEHLCKRILINLESVENRGSFNTAFMAAYISNMPQSIKGVCMIRITFLKVIYSRLSTKKSNGISNKSFWPESRPCERSGHSDTG